ncbi:MAG: hypothetical protein QM756_20850 [Polyangiaceae bacterium]
MPSESSPKNSAPNVFYRYHTGDGRVVIVDSLDRVPSAERARAERVELEAPVSETRFPLVSQVAAGMDWPSFATGFGVALGIAALLSFFGRGSSRLLGMLVVAAIVVAGAGAYFGLLRRSAGLGDGAFATPGAIIDDARRSVEQANKRQREQEKQIEQIQREAK